MKERLLLGMDCETTGLAYSGQVDKNRPDPSHNVITGDTYQAVSWGFIVVDNETLQVIDELYLEVDFNDENTWTEGAAKVHGLTKEHLKQNGLSEEDAAVAIVEFILTYWSIDDAIITLGHHQTTFDHWFLRRLLTKFDIMVKFANRHIDTSSLGWGVFNCQDSNELFSLFGNERNSGHNALDDIKTSFEVYKFTRKLSLKNGL